MGYFYFSQFSWIFIWDKWFKLFENWQKVLVRCSTLMMVIMKFMIRFSVDSLYEVSGGRNMHDDYNTITKYHIEHLWIWQLELNTFEDFHGKMRHTKRDPILVLIIHISLLNFIFLKLDGMVKIHNIASQEKHIFPNEKQHFACSNVPEDWFWVEFENILFQRLIRPKNNVTILWLTLKWVSWICSHKYDKK